jgi:hypothetical protein
MWLPWRCAPRVAASCKYLVLLFVIAREGEAIQPCVHQIWIASLLTRHAMDGLNFGRAQAMA